MLTTDDGRPLANLRDQHIRGLEAQVRALSARVEELEAQAVTDPLTGLANRRGIEAGLRRMVARAERHRAPVCVVLLDVDHFKAVNDTYGHDTGDLVLRRLGDVIKRTLRDTDSAGRWGGEEFILLTENGTDGASTLAERIRALMEQQIIGPVEHPVTVSAGVAQWRPGRDVVKDADTALYAAKRGGRNQVRATAHPEVW